jgi:soluble lytic murein transglycosylase-like protein
MSMNIALARLRITLCMVSVLALAPMPAALAHSHEVSITAAVEAAGLRFGIPQNWIRAVIAAESAGDAAAVSPAGARGLMQLMPSTYAELQRLHGLGADAFAVADNITAGTAYLRQLYDRFGITGMFAAYHAGPGRYRDYLTGARALPEETQRYVRQIANALGLPVHAGRNPMTRSAKASLQNWRQSELFPAAQNLRTVRDDNAAASLSEQDDAHHSKARTPAANPLFAVVRP